MLSPPAGSGREAWPSHLAETDLRIVRTGSGPPWRRAWPLQPIRSISRTWIRCVSPNYVGCALLLTSRCPLRVLGQYDVLAAWAKHGSLLGCTDGTSSGGIPAEGLRECRAIRAAKIHGSEPQATAPMLASATRQGRRVRMLKEAKLPFTHCSGATHYAEISGMRVAPPWRHHAHGWTRGSYGPSVGPRSPPMRT
jgi:hypothetical protein